MCAGWVITSWAVSRVQSLADKDDAQIRVTTRMVGKAASRIKEAGLLVGEEG